MSAAAEVRAFRAAREEGSLPATVNAVHLRAAVRVLEELIGSVDIEEILGKLFGSFCVGK
jgi:tRNA modification GTPase